MKLSHTVKYKGKAVEAITWSNGTAWTNCKNDAAPAQERPRDRDSPRVGRHHRAALQSPCGGGPHSRRRPPKRRAPERLHYSIWCEIVRLSPRAGVFQFEVYSMFFCRQEVYSMFFCRRRSLRVKSLPGEECKVEHESGRCEVWHVVLGTDAEYQSSSACVAGDHTGTCFK
jgi:hypothetical protein